MSMSAQAPIDGEAHGPLSQQHAMDRMYRFQRHIYDATRRYYLVGRDRLIAGLDVPPGGSVLEIGCGTGRNLVKVARTYPTARVHGFDISGEMLKTAGRTIVRSGLLGRIAIAEGDALSFDPRPAFGIPAFDRVYISYTLSMIPEWQQALARAALLVAPGGELHIADFGQCETAPRPMRPALFWWLLRFGVTPRADLPAVLSMIASATDAPCSFHASHGGYAWTLRLGPLKARSPHAG